VSDDDAVALRTKATFEKTYPKNKNCWMTYRDIASKTTYKQKTITLEDLFPKKWITEKLNEYLKGLIPTAETMFDEKDMDL